MRRLRERGGQDRYPPQNTSPLGLTMPEAVRIFKEESGRKDTIRTFAFRRVQYRNIALQEKIRGSGEESTGRGEEKVGRSGSKGE